MRKFSRCVLILLVVSIIAGIGGYIYEEGQISPVYSSTAQLYVVPGEENEASVRASNGGLNNDFMIIFTSNVVISDAQKTLGTTEDISKYLTVSSPANSNIVEIKCTNADQATAKSYVDAIAQTAIKTTSIIPVKSIQILSEGTSTNEAIRPDLYKKTGYIVGVAAGICVILEMIIILIISAFKKPVDNSDDELEYERHYGKYSNSNEEQLLLESKDNKASSKKQNRKNKKVLKKQKSENKKKEKFLNGFDPDKTDFFTDYAENNEKLNKLDDVFKDTAAGVDIDKLATKVINTKAVEAELSKNQAKSTENIANDVVKDNSAKSDVDKEATKEAEKEVTSEELKKNVDEKPEENLTNKEVSEAQEKEVVKESIDNTSNEVKTQDETQVETTVQDTIKEQQDNSNKAVEEKAQDTTEVTNNTIEKPVQGSQEATQTVSDEELDNKELDKATVDNSSESSDILADIEKENKEDDVLADIEKQNQEEDILANIEKENKEAEEDILADIEKEDNSDIVVLGRIQK